MKTKTTKARAKSGAPASRRKIRELMTPEVVVVSPDDTLQLAARRMRERDIGFLPVCDGQRLIGTLSDRDITVRAVAEGRDPKSTPVREFASSQPVWCFDDQDVGEAAQRMQQEQVRRLMVLRREDKRLVGVVSLGDLAANGTREISSDVLESTSPAADRSTQPESKRPTKTWSASFLLHATIPQRGLTALMKSANRP